MSKPKNYCPECRCKGCRGYRTEMKLRGSMKEKRDLARDRERASADSQKMQRRAKHNDKMKLRRVGVWLERYTATSTSDSSFRSIGNQFDVSVTTAMYDYVKICRRIKEADVQERTRPTMAATQRLLAAGALPPAPQWENGCRRDSSSIDFDLLWLIDNASDR